MIPGNMLGITETFNLAGTFAKYTSLSFDGVGFNATLVWDGGAWTLLSGNANTFPI